MWIKFKKKIQTPPPGWAPSRSAMDVHQWWAESADCRGPGYAGTAGCSAGTAAGGSSWRPPAGGDTEGPASCAAPAGSGWRARWPGWSRIGRGWEVRRRESDGTSRSPATSWPTGEKDSGNDGKKRWTPELQPIHSCWYLTKPGENDTLESKSPWFQVWIMFW